MRVHELEVAGGRIDPRAALSLLERTLPRLARDSVERTQQRLRAALLQVLGLINHRVRDDAAERHA